jgi:phosphatidylserine/phosphatidylglycerophosphate/cardiolipin synthase-like enzyme
VSTPQAPHPLAQLTRSELEFLRKAIQKRQIPTPITEIALQSVGKGKLHARLGPLAAAPREAALALIELALGAGDAAPAAAPRTADLVWTGPDVHLSRARPTTLMVRELLGSARQRVLVAGYEFDHGAVIFEPLHRAMVEHGVKVDIYIDIRAAASPRTAIDSYLALQTHRFLKRNWPFGAPLPALYYFPAGVAHGSHRSMHAKCIVVDGARVLVGSANFTRRGHTRNVEVGVRLDDAELAATLTGQLERLVEQGDLKQLAAAAAVREPPPAAAEDEDEDEAAPLPAVVSSAEQLADELCVSAEARALFLRVLAAGLAPPEVGADIAGEDGGVVGSAELSWQVQRVAVLLPEQEGSRKPLEAADWTCFSISLGAGELGALCELVGLERQGAE